MASIYKLNKLLYNAHKYKLDLEMSFIEKIFIINMLPKYLDCIHFRIK